MKIIRCNEYFIIAELNSRSVNGLVLHLLVSSVFAWQAAIQSEGADMCGRTDALLLAVCTPARMDWHNTMLTVVDFKSSNWLKRDPEFGFPFNAAQLKDNYERKWIWVLMKRQAFLNLYMSVCQMGVFILAERVSVRPQPHLRLKLQFHWSV